MSPTERSGPTEDDLSLDEAADRLGVHYQTAYRWVRSGRLPARQVAGRYRVRANDVDAAMEQRDKPVVPPPPSPAVLGRRADEFHEALAAGDEAAARRAVQSLTDAGESITSVIQMVIAPALARIGAAWHAGELSIWVEHRASAIVERILGQHAPNPRGRRRGTVMVGAVSGDRHVLPTSMATVALREHNWHVHHLGADVPADEFVSFRDHHDVDLAVIPVTNPSRRAEAQRIADRLEAGGTPVLLGGPGRSLDSLIDLAAAQSGRGSAPASAADSDR